MQPWIFQHRLSIHHWKIGHVLVEPVDELVQPEESTEVFGIILVFPNLDALSKFLKLIPYNYPNNKGGVSEDIYIIYRKEIIDIVSRAKRN